MSNAHTLQVLTQSPQDNPLHIALFPPYDTNEKVYLEFSFLLNASLDIFEARTRDRNRVDQELGMLQAIDERLSIWGWQTGTGTKFAVIINASGKGTEKGSIADSDAKVLKGVGNGDVRVVSVDVLGEGGLIGTHVYTDLGTQIFKALQTAYVRLLQNPFYVPDEHTPMAAAGGKGKGGRITSKKFIQEVKRIGDTWRPGMSAL